MTVVSALRDVRARAEWCFAPKCSRGGERVTVVSALREVRARDEWRFAPKCSRGGERVTVVSALREVRARKELCFAPVFLPWIESDSGFRPSGGSRP